LNYVIIIELCIQFVYVPIVFDGYFARLLDQTSEFGAWLDVVLDNIGRGLLWTHLHKWGLVISTVEWLTFSFTQRYGAKWKDMFAASPFLIRTIFKNNFRNPLGLTAVTAGLQALPILLFIEKHFSLSTSYSPYFPALIAYCALGRAVCMAAELWIVWRGVRCMLESSDENTGPIKDTNNNYKAGKKQ
jgi:CDP-diacylglycerol--inositol 3-phosphatidyltransferase